MQTFALFPLHPIVDGRCGCGDADCRDVGKHPDHPFGRLGVGEQVRATKPGAGHGIATGSRSGVFVVDLDTKHGVDGIANFEALGDCPDTYTVQSPSGGLHLYFKQPVDFMVANSAGKLAPGVDIRGAGGYVVAAGSPHKLGGRYEVVSDAPVADAPQWLLEWPGLRKAESTGPSKTYEAWGSVPDQGVLDTLAMRLGRVWAPPGGRHTAQLALAGALISAGWAEKDAAAFLVAVCGVAGNADPTKRAETIAHTVMAYEEGRALSGLPTLASVCTDPDTVWSVARELKLVDTVPPEFGEWVKEITKPAAVRACVPTSQVTRRQKNPNHLYSFEPGDAPLEDRKKVAMSEIVLTLHSNPEWEGVWQYDEFKKRLVAVDPPLRLDAETTGLSDVDCFNVALWFEAQGILVTPPQVQSAIHSAARKNGFHPVREYLDSLPEVDRDSAQAFLDHLAPRLFGAEPGSLATVFVRKFLVSAVRRIYRPGIEAQCALVLHSDRQGKYKSTLLKALFGNAWTSNQLPESLSSRDASHALEGFWCVELEELSHLQVSSTEAVRGFLSRATDRYRAFGTGERIEYPRQCVFVGTTNDSDFHRDEAGGRRFWPITIPDDYPVDLQWVRDNRDAIWSAARSLALPIVDGDCAHWLTHDEEEQARAHVRQYAQQESWSEVIENYCAGRKFVRVDDIFTKRIARETSLLRLDGKVRGQIVRVLKRLGCKSVSYTEQGESRRGWLVPGSLQKTVPCAVEMKDRAQEEVADKMWSGRGN